MSDCRTCKGDDRGVFIVTEHWHCDKNGDDYDGFWIDCPDGCTERFREEDGE